MYKYCFVRCLCAIVIKMVRLWKGICKVYKDKIQSGAGLYKSTPLFFISGFFS